MEPIFHALATGSGLTGLEASESRASRAARLEQPHIPSDVRRRHRYQNKTTSSWASPHHGSWPSDGNNGDARAASEQGKPVNDPGSSQPLTLFRGKCLVLFPSFGPTGRLFFFLSLFFFPSPPRIEEALQDPGTHTNLFSFAPLHDRLSGIWRAIDTDIFRKKFSSFSHLPYLLETSGEPGVIFMTHC
jgi:hypothetical protein